MSVGLIGYKCGMTSFFDNEGLVIPVTVVKIYCNYVIGLKTKNINGYSALQISAGYINKSKISKPVLGLCKKNGVFDVKHICEFRIDENELIKYKLGDKLTVSLLEVAKHVDIVGFSKGRGFSGVIRRYGFSAQYASHGNSLSHRAPGSIGQCQTPGRVYKGKKMPGHMGNVRVTSRNIEVIKVYKEEDVVLLKGSIPGAKGCKIFVKNVFN